MLTILHFGPYLLFAGLAFLVLTVLFSEGSTDKRPHPQRLPRQYYGWGGRKAHRD